MIKVTSGLYWHEGMPTFSVPKYSNWVCYLSGRPGEAMSYIIRPVDGQEPNWFNRLMQRLVLGFYWVHQPE